jgi:hypothetical protein
MNQAIIHNCGIDVRQLRAKRIDISQSEGDLISLNRLHDITLDRSHIKLEYSYVMNEIVLRNESYMQISKRLVLTDKSKPLMMRSDVDNTSTLRYINYL